MKNTETNIRATDETRNDLPDPIAIEHKERDKVQRGWNSLTLKSSLNRPSMNFSKVGSYTNGNTGVVESKVSQAEIRR